MLKAQVSKGNGIQMCTSMHMCMGEIIGFNKDSMLIMIMGNTIIKYILDNECSSYLEVIGLFLIYN